MEDHYVISLPLFIYIFFCVCVFYLHVCLYTAVCAWYPRRSGKVLEPLNWSYRWLGTVVFFIIFVYVCVGVHVCHSAHVAVQGQLVGLCLFLYHMGLGT